MIYLKLPSQILFNQYSQQQSEEVKFYSPNIVKNKESNLISQQKHIVIVNFMPKKTKKKKRDSNVWLIDQ